MHYADTCSVFIVLIITGRNALQTLLLRSMVTRWNWEILDNGKYFSVTVINAI